MASVASQQFNDKVRTHLFVPEGIVLQFWCFQLKSCTDGDCEVLAVRGGAEPWVNDFSSFYLSLSSLEFSDAKVYAPEERSLLGTASQFCEVVVLESKTICSSRFGRCFVCLVRWWMMWCSDSPATLGRDGLFERD